MTAGWRNRLRQLDPAPQRSRAVGRSLNFDHEVGAILAQPAGTVRGRIRVTEQGEIIASHYSNPALAHRHLEQVVSAVLEASAPFCRDGDGGREKTTIPVEWRKAMTRLAERARSCYRALVYETPGFLDYWAQATPIDEIKRLQIGSRPAARASSSDRPI